MAMEADRADGRVMKTAPVLLAALLLAGCGADDSSTAPAETSEAPASGPIVNDEHHFVVFEHADWDLQEAVDYEPGHPFSTIGGGLVPATDWYAEYDHEPVDLAGGVIRVDYLKIAALDGPMSETTERFAALGYETEPVMVGSVPGRVSREPVALEFDTLLLLDGGHQTILLESGDLDVAELLVIAADLRPVDDTGWVAFGGVSV